MKKKNQIWQVSPEQLQLCGPARAASFAVTGPGAQKSRTSIYGPEPPVSPAGRKRQQSYSILESWAAHCGALSYVLYAYGAIKRRIVRRYRDGLMETLRTAAGRVRDPWMLGWRAGSSR